MFVAQLRVIRYPPERNFVASQTGSFGLLPYARCAFEELLLEVIARVFLAK